MRPRSLATMLVAFFTTLILVYLYRNPIQSYKIDEDDRIVIDVDTSDRTVIDEIDAEMPFDSPIAKYPPLIPHLDHSSLSLQALPATYQTYFPSLHLPTSFDTPLLRDLGRRLDVFLRRPVRSYEEAKDDNERGCPLRLMDQMVPKDQVENESAFWKALSKEEIVNRRAGIVKELEGQVQQEKEVVWDGGRDGGRGIVLTGGNGVSCSHLSKSDWVVRGLILMMVCV